jgi:holo-[acyl-carrier protein] synthase
MTQMSAPALLTTLVSAWRTLRAEVRERPRRAKSDPLHVGVDLVEVETVAAALALRSERYLDLVYSEAERDDCMTRFGLDASRLAARFAAKEAVMKALGAGGEELPWRSIHVVRGPKGQPLVQLDEPAAAVAAALDIGRFSLSLSHESRYATAVVVATR